MVKRLIFALLLLTVLFVTACHVGLPAGKIDRYPPVAPSEIVVWETLPEIDNTYAIALPANLFEADLSNLDLRDSQDVLAFATFDDATIWPSDEYLPADFDWQQMMELGKNPGLGVRALHDQGITGKGVSIGMIGPPLLVEHQEYVDRIRLYAEINVRPSDEATVDGTHLASLTVGETVGIAPQADLYYIATWAGDTSQITDDNLDFDWTDYARAFERLMEINSTLPDDGKIGIIVTMASWYNQNEGFEAVTAAVLQAEDMGIYVLSTTPSEDMVRGFSYNGAGRDPLADPERFDSFGPGALWAGSVDQVPLNGMTLFPADCRASASPLAKDAYTFWRVGGLEKVIPYIGGLYALATQVEPDMTRQTFRSTIGRTSQDLIVEIDGAERHIGQIIDPVALIEVVE